jgi:hypothetical protein
MGEPYTRKVNYYSIDDPWTGATATIRYDTEYGMLLPEEIQFPGKDEWVTFKYDATSTPYDEKKGHEINIGNNPWYMLKTGPNIMAFTNYETRMSFKTEYDEVPAEH